MTRISGGVGMHNYIDQISSNKATLNSGMTQMTMQVAPLGGASTNVIINCAKKNVTAIFNNVRR